MIRLRTALLAARGGAARLSPALLCARLSSSPTKKLRRAAAAANPPAPKRALRPITIALCGRPNVGKSSLFNRLVKSRLAIVNATPGTTRDWKEAEGQLGELRFTILDTGGLDGSSGGGGGGHTARVGAPPSAAASMESKMLAHTERAIAGADLVLYLVDARRGVAPEDERFAKWVKARRPQGGVHLVANKAEGLVGRAGAGGEDRWESLVASCYTLGFGAPIAVSAEHGEGLGALYAVAEPYALIKEGALEEESGGRSAARVPPSPLALVANDLEARAGSSSSITAPHVLPEGGTAKRRRAVEARLARIEAGVIHLAIVGRPNVGKSTLVNQLLGEERQLVGPTPGLTRDAVEVVLPLGDGRSVRLVDTAGMRRWGTWDLSTALEGLAVGQAKKALALANVVALVVDGSGGAVAGLTTEPITFFGLSEDAPSPPLPSEVDTTRVGGEEEDAAPRAWDNAARGSRRAPPAPSMTQRRAQSTAAATASVVDAAVAAAASRASSAATSPASAAAVATWARARASRLEGVEGGAFGLTRQDLAIASQVLDEGRGLVIVLNKMDAAGPELAAEVARVVRGQVDALHQGRGASIIPVSALRGGGIEQLLPAVVRTYDTWNVRVSTGKLNAWLALVTRHHPPPVLARTVARKRGGAKTAQDGTPLGAYTTVPLPLRIKYLTQVNARPPTFTAFVNRAAGFPESYKRFLVNALRDEFGFAGVPVRFLVSAPTNPFSRQGVAAANTARAAAAVSASYTRGKGGISPIASPLSPNAGAARAPRASARAVRPGSRERRAAALAAETTMPSTGRVVRRYGVGTPDAPAKVIPFARSATAAVRAATLPGGKMRYLSRKQKRVLRDAL